MFAPFGHAGGDGGVASGTEEGFGLVEGCGVCVGQKRVEMERDGRMTWEVRDDMGGDKTLGSCSKRRAGGADNEPSYINTVPYPALYSAIFPLMNGHACGPRTGYTILISLILHRHKLPRYQVHHSPHTPPPQYPTTYSARPQAPR